MRKLLFRYWDNIDYMSNPFSFQDVQGGKIPFTKHCKVMQFTGLKDKNGKDIYEGDILEFDGDEWGSDKGNRWAVEWDNESGEWQTGGGTNQECKSFKTVIGNIYKNPELLKQ